MERGCCELEAESIAFTTLHYFGLDASDYSFGYVAHWAGGPEAVNVLRAVGQKVQKVAREIIDAVAEKAGQAEAAAA